MRRISPARSFVWVALALACTPGESEDGARDSANPSQSAGSSDSAETGSNQEQGRSLIDHLAWEEVPAAEDPLADHRPTEVLCSVAGWYVEGQSTEVDTNECNYLALRQPTLVDIHEGDTLLINFYHFDLKADDPALAHIAVMIDAELVWEDNIEIPRAAYVHTHELAAPFDAPAGTELNFHLHNHGQNTWSLQALEVR